MCHIYMCQCDCDRGIRNIFCGTSNANDIVNFTIMVGIKSAMSTPLCVDVIFHGNSMIHKQQKWPVISINTLMVAPCELIFLTFYLYMQDEELIKMCSSDVSAMCCCWPYHQFQHVSPGIHKKESTKLSKLGYKGNKYIDRCTGINVPMFCAFVKAKIADIYHVLHDDVMVVTGHLCGEFTGPRWITRTKASVAELWCFLSSVSEQTVE